MATQFNTIPVHEETKEEIADLRYDLRVDSMDAVIRELLEDRSEAST